MALAPLDPLAVQLADELAPFGGPMLAGLERAITDRTGERVPREAWDLRSLPAYLSLNFVVVDEHDKVVEHGRDLAGLQRSLGARARQLWAAAPRERYEKTGLTSWDFGELPAQVTIDVGGRKVAAYPALVAQETSVDLRLLESPAAAADANRDGLRKLFMIQLRTSPGKLEVQLSGALASGPLVIPGAPVPLRRQLVLRALDEAFNLGEGAALPRDKAAFAARLEEGRDSLPVAIAQLNQIAVELNAELDKVRLALKPLAGKPGLPKAVYDDVQSQLGHLAPPDLLTRASPARLAHIARYVRAVLVRLQRQANDPPKDQQKAAQVAPLWQKYLAKRDELRGKGRTSPELDEVGWLIEELRVATFAPELKTAVPVSPQRVQDAWARVR